MFALTEQKHLEIGFGKIIFLSNWGFHDDLSRVVTKISSCRVFVFSSRGSHKQSCSPPPPPDFGLRPHGLLTKSPFGLEE